MAKLRGSDFKMSIIFFFSKETLFNPGATNSQVIEGLDGANKGAMESMIEESVPKDTTSNRTQVISGDFWKIFSVIFIQTLELLLLCC